MKHILDKNNLTKVNEKYTLSANTLVWVHHPITEDLVKALISNTRHLTVILKMPEDSPYAGQPEWEIKKSKIIGIV